MRSGRSESLQFRRSLPTPRRSTGSTCRSRSATKLRPTRPQRGTTRCSPRSARAQPSAARHSTATGKNAGIGKQLWDYAVRVLEGTQDDERPFALIYTIDPEDDPWEEASGIKADPSWGQAQPQAIRAIMRQARNNPAQEAAAKSRHLNIWVSADEALFSMRSWRECANSSHSLDDFEGKERHLALDLASRTDLAALAIVFPHRIPRRARRLHRVRAPLCQRRRGVEARNRPIPVGPRKAIL